MTEVESNENQAPVVQKDKHGIEIVTDFPEPQFPGQKGYECWAFLQTNNLKSFFARFRRLVNVNGLHYAEVDYSHFSNTPQRKVRWILLADIPELGALHPGVDVNCIRLFGKTYVLALEGQGHGRKLSQTEWDQICKGRHWYPEHYNHLVET
ncbi:hypothetical protein Metfor_1376 [Methanoregula formicica SMSP]|uniref:Uncharacterized protein n=1 Tax=Methanoregula formicica (strain DSM 22288 / NBRC 105244 / SMSP) TaxID=593750 RepID=L0HEG4_METFS|nr:hypothetical protein Metfor_1376 [Methanoregula formicica SMSP]